MLIKFTQPAIFFGAGHSSVFFLSFPQVFSGNPVSSICSGSRLRPKMTYEGVYKQILNGCFTDFLS